MSRAARLGFALALASGLFAQNTHWVETWTAAQQPTGGGPATVFRDQTVRMVLHTTIAGNRLRLEFANTYGKTPLHIDAAHVALRAAGSSTVSGSDRALTVNGSHSFTVPTAAVLLTDPVDLTVPALADLAVSIYVADTAPALTRHTLGLHTTYIGSGNLTGQPSIEDAKSSTSYYWVSSVQVVAPADAGAVVAFGDSITDGTHSTPEENRMWPAVLAARILSVKRGPQVSVINEGISGNQVLHDRAGLNALARFDHDVLARAGVRWLIILEGINDIGHTFGPDSPPDMLVTAEEIIGGHRQMIERAHAHGIKAIGATLTPFEGSPYFAEKGEAARQAVNAWIRSSHLYDAVIDFDALTRDPAHPLRFRAEFDSGDHLHPNDAGYKAMADSIDLALFR